LGNGDKVFDRNGIPFVIAKEFFERIKPMVVDYIAASNDSTFSISTMIYNYSLPVLL
jgi:hypothetical protein